MSAYYAMRNNNNNNNTETRGPLNETALYRPFLRTRQSHCSNVSNVLMMVMTAKDLSCFNSFQLACSDLH